MGKMNLIAKVMAAQSLKVSQSEEVVESLDLKACLWIVPHNIPRV